MATLKVILARKDGDGMGRGKLQAFLAVCFFILGTFTVSAQGTLEFSVFLSGPNTQSTGEGIFTLTDHSFMYDVSLAFGFSVAEIRGPGPASDAPSVFALDLDFCTVPGPNGIPPGGCNFRGSETISDIQIAGLVGGEWYVWGHSPTAPSRPMSGQIVPEPTVTVLYCVSLFVVSAFWMFRKIRVQTLIATSNHSVEQR